MKTEYKILDKGYVQYRTHLGTDLDPVIAARISTGKPSGVDESDDDRLRDYLYRHAHVSTFEYNILRVEIKVPIFCSRQIIRHRTLDITDLTAGIPANIAANEFSARYAEVIQECYVPEFDRVLGESKINKQGSEQELGENERNLFIEMCEDSEDAFKEEFATARELGVAKELARINAPVSNYTVLLLQGNLRNWLHFINLRIKPNAQYEVRVVAEAILEMIKELWPKVYESFVEHTLEAKSFSKTEIKVLEEWMIRLMGSVDEDKTESAFDDICASNNLNKSRTRELKSKMNFGF
jgi:thymidylate synthase (FAD)